VTDFFTPDITYIRNEPFKAPELLGLFKCVAVTTHPASGGLRAFGFEATAYPGDNWSSASYRVEEWEDGWLAADRVDGRWMPRTGTWGAPDA
jgi:hypothetical protein